VFDTGRRRLYLRTQPNPEIRFIDFNRLDFSCQAPVKMLDINAKLNGDITGQLHIYSYQEHYAHALANGRKWGLNMTPDELAEALKFYDSFPCGN
jgi:hypothetical protein